MTLDLEIQITILDFLKSTKEKSKPYVSTLDIAISTHIPMEQVEENLLHLIDKKFVEYDPRWSTPGPSRGIGATSEGINFINRHKIIRARVKHLQELKEHAVKPLIENLDEMNLNPEVDICVDYLIRNVDSVLYEDLPIHFSWLRKYIPEIELEIENAFSGKVEDFFESLNKRNESLRQFRTALHDALLTYKLQNACSLLGIGNNEEIVDVEEFLEANWGMINELAGRFQTYWSKPDSQKIKEWLLQFGDVRYIKFALKLLQSIEYIGDGKMQDIFRDFYDSLSPEEKDKAVFTIFGPLDESSPQVISKCSKALTEKERRKAWFQPLREVIKGRKAKDTIVIFVDDFIGSGTQACDVLAELWGEGTKREYIKVPLDEIEKDWLRRTTLVYFTLIGIDIGGLRLEEKAKEYGLELRVHCAIKTERQYGCFSPQSRIFDDRAEREEARELAFRIG